MNQFLKQAYAMGAQQALAELGLPGIDLDSLIQEAHSATTAAGGQEQDAGSIAERAVGNNPQSAYSILGALSSGGL